ncbi:MAG: hypothetical protein KIT22_07905 [Verrucomicrobiae bacterium]|nr:hypothetical protein [Verrucomicrobiae bacterium]
MSRILPLLILVSVLSGVALGQGTPVMVHTNNALYGRFTNFFRQNAELLNDVTIGRTNPTLVGLTVTNGLRVEGVATNRLMYVGADGVVVSLAGVDPSLLLHLIGLNDNIQAQLNLLLANGGGPGISATNGTAYNLTLSGITAVDGLLANGTNVAVFGAAVITSTNYGSYPGTVATIPYVNMRAPIVAPTLAALKEAPIIYGIYLLGTVLYDTDGDGSAGDWFLDPYSTASESAVIIRPDGYSALEPGRWIKR